MKWMNENTIEELKKKRKTLHTIALMTMMSFFIALGGFLFTWCFTIDTFLPLPLAIISMALAVLFSLLILKREIISVFLFLKEATIEPEEMKP